MESDSSENSYDDIKRRYYFGGGFRDYDEMLKLIEGSGLPITGKDSKGWAPLHIAIKMCNAECIKYLLEKGCDVNLYTPPLEGDDEEYSAVSPILLAAEAGSVECFDILLHHHANIDDTDFAGQTPLMYAVRSNKMEMAKHLIEKHNVDVDEEAHYGGTALHTAVVTENVDMVTLLLKHNARLDIQSTDDFSPLLYAAQNGNEEILKLLLQAGEERGQDPSQDMVNVSASDHATPLYIAAQNNHLGCIKILLGYDADPNIATRKPTSLPLFAALNGGHFRCARFLYPLTDLQGLNCDPFQLAFWTERPEALKLLMDLGVYINGIYPVTEHIKFFVEVPEIYRLRGTPLFQACKDNNRKLANALLDLGANINEGQPSPLLAAICNGGDFMTLIGRGAHLNIYHPRVSFNMTILAALTVDDNGYSLHEVLKAGAEAHSCFKPLHVTLPTSTDQGQLDELDLRGIPLAGNNIITLRKAVEMLKSEYRSPFKNEYKIANIIKTLLQYTPAPGTGRLGEFSLLVYDHRYSKEVRMLLGKPSSLTQLSRIAIRDALTAKNLNRRVLNSLLIPKLHVDYILHEEG